MNLHDPPHYRDKKERYLLDPSQITVVVRVVVVTDAINCDALVPMLVQCTQADFVANRHCEKALAHAQQQVDSDAWMVWDEFVTPAFVLEQLYPGYDDHRPDQVNSDVEVLDITK